MPPGCARGWTAGLVTPREQIHCAAIENEKSLCQQADKGRRWITLRNNASGQKAGITEGFLQG